MAKETANVTSDPKVITKEEADKLDNFAQGLNDEVTHVVDYGGVEEPKKGRKK